MPPKRKSQLTASADAKKAKKETPKKEAPVKVPKKEAPEKEAPEKEAPEKDAAEVEPRQARRRRKTPHEEPKPEPDAIEEIKDLIDEGESEAGDSDLQTKEEVLVVEAVRPRKAVAARKSKTGRGGKEWGCQFLGDPVPHNEARQRWPDRYGGKNKEKAVDAKQSANGADELINRARRHYLKAKVDGTVYDLNDNAYVQAGESEADYICKIVEMFEGEGGSLYFTARWFYRASDTAIKDLSDLIDKKRVFLSEIHDDNPLECLVKKLDIIKVDLEVTKATIPPCDYYYDSLYLLPFSTFKKVPAEERKDGNETSSTISSDGGTSKPNEEVNSGGGEATLLDMYSGCGAMSTGLCLGANFGGLNLVTKWAVDLNQNACSSLSFNHPGTEVRNEKAEDFLALLKEWKKLCTAAELIENTDQDQSYIDLLNTNDEENVEDEENAEDGNDSEIFEVEKILAIQYGDPNNIEQHGLYLQVRWKGYGPEEDTWEPIEGLCNCGKRIQEFIDRGYTSKILPLPGDVDVLCGGPPCQGISGFNRFRDKNNPLKDDQNKQLPVFMDLVDYLKPRFVLMENVVDLLKFANGYLGRYALGRLVDMKYQARIGIMAAGAYGLPQFRMRVFVWGAQASEKLPQYPYPTHDVVVRGCTPVEFENNTVAYEKECALDHLEKKLLLEDAISDLPAVGTYEDRDEMQYEKDPETNFQRFIRLSKQDMMGSSSNSKEPEFNQVLHDHRSLQLSADDYERVCMIPKKKGANFRDLPGVIVVGKKVELDTSSERIYLKSKKPLIPDYAISFKNGTSLKPFGRLWWDETVSTVVTRAEPHNQAVLHPEQDRVLSIRENARLQGFPDYYKLMGPVKQRYIQVGNAVAVPVARALGYTLSLAFGDDDVEDGTALTELPASFYPKLSKF